MAGDQPVVLLDTNKIHEYGWYSRRNSTEAVRTAARTTPRKRSLPAHRRIALGMKQEPDRSRAVGIWHLGAVNAAGFAEKGYQVIGLEFDPKKAKRLQAGTPPLFEPGLEELMKKHLATGKLSLRE